MTPALEYSIFLIELSRLDGGTTTIENLLEHVEHEACPLCYQDKSVKVTKKFINLPRYENNSINKMNCNSLSDKMY